MDRAPQTISPVISPTVIPRPEHRISRAGISENALRVLYGLKKGGFEAYLVGGGVRDLLLGREPKDFDVATDARPEQVRRLFRNCRLIGRRFRLAHVFFGREVIEVATFRAAPTGEDDQHVVEEGRILRDNFWGTVEEDAMRRDFTINSLYYNIRDFSVIDYANGLEDLRNGVVRLLGDPRTRYREDPVRMLRAVRFAAKLGFRIETQTEGPMRDLGHLLREIPAARLFDEVLKLFHGGCALDTFELLRHYGLFQWLFPATEEALAHEEEGFPITFVSRALRNTDLRVNEGKPVTPAFLYAALLWEPVRHRALHYQEQGMGEGVALQQAGQEISMEQAASTALPRRFAIPMREIWAMQPRFRQRGGKRAMRLLGHPRFRAAYDFMCLRAQAGEELGDACEWWTRIQEADDDQRPKMIQPARGKRRPRRRRPRPNADKQGG